MAVLTPVARWGGLWRAGDVVAVLALNAAALVVIGACWYRVAGDETVTAQLAVVNLSVAALVASAVGNGWLLLRGRRWVTRARARLLPGVSVPPEASDPISLPSETVLSAPGLTRYHRPQCPLTADKTMAPIELGECHRAGLRPCEACEP